MKKYIFLIILLTGSLLLFYSPSRQVLAITVEELQQQIQALQQIINQLLQQLKQLQATQPVTTPPITSPGLPQGQYCFTTTLCPGAFSEEVKKLQTVLGVQPVDGYFDYRTKLAVEKFQRDNGIQVTGCTGPLTRAKLNELFCKPSPTPIVEPECNTDSDCTWCGGCIAKKRVPIGGLCPDLAKPTGMDCKCISGECTLSQVSPTTTTTKVVNRYSCRTVPATIPSNISQMCIPDPNGPFSSLEDCQNVCGSNISCVDSDGGTNIFTKGTVIYKGIQYTDTCEQCVAPNCVPLTTSCKASCTAVKEYFCQGGTVQATTYPCPPNYECIDGACKQISASSIKVISPNGGEKWKMGETYEIRWSSTNLPSESEVNIQLSYIYAGATSPLEASIATQIKNSGSYRWTIPTTGVIAEILGKSDPNAYQIRVVTPNNPYLGDYSDGYFTILPPPPSSVLSCNDLAITFYRRFYLDMCKGKGFDKVCFDKYTAEFQGCGKSTYNDCTVNNINANRNIWCDIQPLPPTCIDSDGGRSYYAKGKLSYINNPYGVVEVEDRCLNEYTLLEGVCNSQTDYVRNVEQFRCPERYKCQDGVCKEIISSLPDLTINPEAGIILSSPGTNPRVGDTYAYFDVSIANIGTATATPPAEGIDVICSLNNYPTGPTAPDIVLGVTFTKPIGPNSHLTAYRVTTVANSSLLATAGDKIVYCVVDATNRIIESNEDNNKLRFYLTVEPSNTTCTDSDGGKNYYVAGSTTGYKAFWGQIPQNITTEKDFCTTICEGNVGGGKATSGPCLVEFYCDQNNYAAFEVFRCPSGYTCQDGACKQSASNYKEIMEILKQLTASLYDLLNTIRR